MPVHLGLEPNGITIDFCPCIVRFYKHYVSFDAGSINQLISPVTLHCTQHKQRESFSGDKSCGVRVPQIELGYVAGIRPHVFMCISVHICIFLAMTTICLRFVIYALSFNEVLRPGRLSILRTWSHRVDYLLWQILFDWIYNTFVGASRLICVFIFTFEPKSLTKPVESFPNPFQAKSINLDIFPHFSLTSSRSSSCCAKVVQLVWSKKQLHNA